MRGEAPPPSPKLRPGRLAPPHSPPDRDLPVPASPHTSSGLGGGSLEHPQERLRGRHPGQPPGHSGPLSGIEFPERQRSFETGGSPVPTPHPFQTSQERCHGGRLQAYLCRCLYLCRLHPVGHLKDRCPGWALPRLGPVPHAGPRSILTPEGAHTCGGAHLAHLSALLSRWPQQLAAGTGNPDGERDRQRFPRGRGDPGGCAGEAADPQFLWASQGSPGVTGCLPADISCLQTETMRAVGVGLCVHSA